jgi:hypothetical protein
MNTGQTDYIRHMFLRVDPSGRAVWGLGLWKLVAGIAGSNFAGGTDVCLL